MQINRDRLAQTFKHLVEIDSVSKDEARVCYEIRKIAESMGAQTAVDNAGEKIGGNTGNLFIKFPGNTQAPPLLLCAHMDTVEPGKGIRVIFKDGIFTSDGTTILGADDKSAIAPILEAVRVIQDYQLPYGPLEIVFTIAEEIGLLGAKNLDYRMLSSKSGFVLDATDINGIVTRAPAANRIDIKIHGRESHAGAAPEKGINAIHLAAKAMAGLELGRIDHETTCNIGLIEGGTATNIVPNLVKIRGEARSHDVKKLENITQTIAFAFKTAVENYGVAADGLPKAEVEVEQDFPKTHVPDNDPLVLLAIRAAENLGRKMITKASGGGADANIFSNRGISTVVLGTGMLDLHTLKESVALDDMVKSAELLVEIIRLHCR